MTSKSQQKRTLRQRRGKPSRTVRKAFYVTQEEADAIEAHIIDNTELETFTDFCRLAVMSYVNQTVKPLK